jgi:hypothetical protein
MNSGCSGVTHRERDFKCVRLGVAMAFTNETQTGDWVKDRLPQIQVRQRVLRE